MSLIDDAIRRARQMQQNNLPAGGQPLIPIKPKPSDIGWVLPVTAGVFFAAACFFLGLSLANRTQPPAAVARRLPVKQPDKPVSAQQTPSPAASPAAQPPVAMVTPSLPPQPSPSPPPEPKLQGIIFEQVRLGAIVNGKTVYAGDHVGNYLVEEISKTAVVLKKADKTRIVLELER